MKPKYYVYKITKTKDVYCLGSFHSINLAMKYMNEGNNNNKEDIRYHMLTAMLSETFEQAYIRVLSGLTMRK